MRGANRPPRLALVASLFAVPFFAAGVVIPVESRVAGARITPATDTVVLDATALHQLQHRLARFGTDLPDPKLLSMDRVSAYYEHARFTYAVLRSGPPVSPWQQPIHEYRVLCIKPDVLVLLRWHRAWETAYTLQAPGGATLNETAGGGLDANLRGREFSVRARLLTAAEITIMQKGTGATDRGGINDRIQCRVTHRDGEPVNVDVWLLRTGDRPQAPALPRSRVWTEEAKLIVSVEVAGETYELLFPRDGADPGLLRTGGRGSSFEHPLPAGVLPHGEAGANLIERWNRAYAPGQTPPWDTGRPDSQLRRAVESGRLKPCSVIEFGCGTGTNAIYLAGQGFEVTGLDVAPRAIAIARKKAEEAGVRARFYVADVLQLPEGLPRYDLVFDRGCYHGVRRFAAEGYVNSVLRVTHPGSLVFILAGNANEARHYGPPRVTEKDLVGDFAEHFAFLSLETIRFDTREQDAAGALGWRVLLERRRAQSSRDSGTAP